jgi:hypothetical protein
MKTDRGRGAAMVGEVQVFVVQQFAVICTSTKEAAAMADANGGAVGHRASKHHPGNKAELPAKWPAMLDVERDRLLEETASIRKGVFSTERDPSAHSQAILEECGGLQGQST